MGSIVNQEEIRRKDVAEVAKTSGGVLNHPKSGDFGYAQITHTSDRGGGDRGCPRVTALVETAPAAGRRADATALAVRVLAVTARAATVVGTVAGPVDATELPERPALAEAQDARHAARDARLGAPAARHAAPGVQLVARAVQLAAPAARLVALDVPSEVAALGAQLAVGATAVAESAGRLPRPLGRRGPDRALPDRVARAAFPERVAVSDRRLADPGVQPAAGVATPRAAAIPVADARFSVADAQPLAADVQHWAVRRLGDQRSDDRHSVDFRPVGRALDEPSPGDRASMDEVGEWPATY